MTLFSKIAIGATTLFGGIAATSAAPYELAAADVTTFGTVATDVADSLIGTLMSILPVAIPLLVVGFIISLILRFARNR